MDAFATIDDVMTLWRPLKPDEFDRARALLCPNLCVKKRVRLGRIWIK